MATPVIRTARLKLVAADARLARAAVAGSGVLEEVLDAKVPGSWPPPDLADALEFIAAQMEAFLEGDLWLRLARHANGLADRLGDGLAQAGYAPVWPVEANEVFAALPVALCDRLQAAGAMFYRWDGDAKGHVIVRLVTSFQTTAEDVERFLTAIRAG